MASLSVGSGPMSASSVSYNRDFTGRPYTGGSQALSTGADAIQSMVDLQNANNAWSASQAALQRDWQVQQNRVAMDFNAAEAAKNRDWQQFMSSTAHQREVQDLKAAGLNPVLSALNGNGAAVGSGATASGVTSSGAKGDVDTSASGAIATLMSALYQQQTQMEVARVNAQSNQAIADRNNASAELIAQIAGVFGNERAHISGQYGLSQSAQSASAVQAAATIAALASMTNMDKSVASARDVQSMRNASDQYMQRVLLGHQSSEAQKSREFEERMKSVYPQSTAGILSSLFKELNDYQSSLYGIGEKFDPSSLGSTLVGLWDKATDWLVPPGEEKYHVRPFWYLRKDKKSK